MSPRKKNAAPNPPAETTETAQEPPSRRVPTPPAALGLSPLQDAPWRAHPLCSAMEGLPEELSLSELNDRLPSRLARLPLSNGWSASIVLFGHPENASALFEIAPIYPEGGLRDESIMAYLSAKETNEALHELAALPDFDAPLRQALDSGSLQAALAPLRAARRSKSLASFDGRVKGSCLSMPSYAEEALRVRKARAKGGRDKLDLDFARRAWVALIKAGAELGAEDFDSALQTALRHDEDDAAKRAALMERLAQKLFRPVLDFDQAAGGSLAERASASAEPELAGLLGRVIAQIEAEALRRVSTQAPQRKRSVGL